MEVPEPNRDSWPVQLAKASWVTPVLVIGVSWFLRDTPEFSSVRPKIFMFFYGLGLLFGILALFGIRRHGAKGILRPALIGIVVCGVILLVSRIPDRVEELDDSEIVALAKSAAETANAEQKYPLKIDEVTILEGVRADGRELIYDYSVNDSEGVVEGEVIELLVVPRFCSQMAPLLKAGVWITLSYGNSEGESVLQRTIDFSQCERLTRSEDAPELTDQPTATAALRSVLAGYSIDFDSAELTEQCRVEDSSASIDDIERVANDYGLKAQQLIYPESSLSNPESLPLPAILIAYGNEDSLEFINVWRREGTKVQIMDPLEGVSWIEWSDLASRAYIHEMELEDQAYRGFVAVVVEGRRR